MNATKMVNKFSAARDSLMAGFVANDVEKNVSNNPNVDVVKEDNPNPKNIEVIELEDYDLKVPEKDDAISYVPKHCQQIKRYIPK